MTIQLGDTVPDIPLPATDGKTVQLSDFRGKNVVLYFYPKANTPGCTQEGKDFTAGQTRLQSRYAVVLGVSRDTLKAQQSFKDHQGFPFDLIADQEEQLCSAFDVMKMKKMYGRDTRGIERSTFLIDAEGKLRKEWRKVKVPGHVDEVLAALDALY